MAPVRVGGEIQRADPEARKRLLARFILVAALGVLALLIAEQLRPLALAWVTAEAGVSAARRALLLTGLLAVACLPVAGFALYVMRLGGAVCAARQFPLPRTKLLRDTRVLRGAAAVMRGRMLQAMGAGLLLATVALLVCAWWLARLLLRS